MRILRGDQIAHDRPPFDNLSPVVDFLVLLGNATAEGGFRDSQAGFYCLMTKPIDFDALESAFEFPDEIELNREADTIFDRTTWIAIFGSNNTSIPKKQ